jgi:probable HAF family extracellular repeat protein
MQASALRAVVLVSGFAAAVAAASTAQAASFSGLGYLPGDDASSAAAVSPDGSVVVGWTVNRSDPSTPSQAFRWTASGGMVGLGDLPGGEFESLATGVSAQGEVVVGRARPEPAPGPVDEAFYWTGGSGMVGIGDLPGGETGSEAHAISADGSTIVGQGSSAAADHEAFVWTSSGGMLGLGGLPGVPVGSIAYGVSGDGSIIVGSVVANLEEDDHAFLWTQSAGMLDLGTLPGGYFSGAQAVTPDGSIVVGESSTGIDTTEAFRWTQASGMVGLGNLPGGNRSTAFALSADGSVIVGVGSGTASPDTAVIWFVGDSAPRVLKDVLIADFGLDLTGWDLRSAAGISADGLTIVGSGINPSGQPEAWIAVIPEPSTGLQLALGLAGLARLRVRRSRHEVESGPRLDQRS